MPAGESLRQLPSGERPDVENALEPRSVECLGQQISLLGHWNEALRIEAAETLLQLTGMSSPTVVLADDARNLLSGARQYVQATRWIVSRLADMLVSCRMVLAVIVHLEGMYTDHPSPTTRAIAMVAAAEIAAKSPLDPDSRATAFTNMCFMLDHHELLSGHRVCILNAISSMAPKCLIQRGSGSEAFALGAQTLRRIMTLPHKTKEEIDAAEDAIKRLLESSGDATRRCVNGESVIFVVCVGFSTLTSLMPPPPPPPPPDTHLITQSKRVDQCIHVSIVWSAVHRRL